VAQIVEPLPSNCEALSSNPIPEERERERERRKRNIVGWLYLFYPEIPFLEICCKEIKSLPPNKGDVFVTVLFPVAKTRSNEYA
jgi:hypothetical protein